MIIYTVIYIQYFGRKRQKKHKNRKSMVPFTSFIQISESLPATAYLQ